MASDVLANHLTADDHWRYIMYAGDEVRLALPRPFEVVRVVVRESRHYKRMRKVALFLEADARPVAELAVPDEPSALTFEFAPRRLTSLRLKATAFDDIGPGGPFGWDTVEICRVTPASFAKNVAPLTVPAGVVKFPIGRGGILLSMVKLGDPTANRAFLQILHNLGARRTDAAAGGQEPGKKDLDDVIDELDFR